MKWREYYEKLRQWEAEGYDVSELKQKWFPENRRGGRSLARIALSLVVVAITMVGGLLIWQHISSGLPGDETVATLSPSIVAATVNVERITEEDVAGLQARSGMSISYDQALEHLITEKLLYQEATNKGHELSMSDAESELETQLAEMNMTREDLDLQLQQHGISYQEYLEGYRTGLSIQNYLEATIEVTEEEARARYDELTELYGDQLPPFFTVKQQIIAELQQEAMPYLIEELRDKADVEVHTFDLSNGT